MSPASHARTKLWFITIPFVLLMVLGAVLLVFSSAVRTPGDATTLYLPLAVPGILLLLIGAIAIGLLRLRG